jgi:hypothetical protein
MEDCVKHLGESVLAHLPRIEGHSIGLKLYRRQWFPAYGVPQLRYRGRNASWKAMRRILIQWDRR